MVTALTLAAACALFSLPLLRDPLVARSRRRGGRLARVWDAYARWATTPTRWEARQAVREAERILERSCSAG